MNMHRLLSPFLLLFAIALPAQAEQYRQFDDYRIHYSAFKADMVEPAIARAHGLTRSRYRAIVNITVQKRDGDNGYRAVPAAISGSARDIHSTINKLKFKEVTEGKAIYYLAELPIVDEQRLTFTIKAIPEGERAARKFTFERQFFVD